MKKVLIIMFFVILLTGIAFAESPSGHYSNATDPAAKYCVDLGYEYNEETCVLPDGTNCSSWSFYRGICGKKYTFCEQNGYTVQNREENMGTWTANYSVCIFDDDSECKEQDYFKGSCRYKEKKTDEDDEVEEGYQFRYKEQFKEKNRLKFENKTGAECPDTCNCQGSVLTCPMEDGGANMTIYAGKSENIIIHIKGVNVTTNVSIYNENGTLFGVFRNNDTREIKILPDKIMDKIRERIKAKLEAHNITLDENRTYLIQAQKKARLFFMFPVDEKMEIDMDSETGEIIQANGPWWGFLARDIKED